MALLARTLLVITLLCALSEAMPLKRTGTISALSSAQISAFKPYTFYAAAAYCSATTTAYCSCGKNCAANPTFLPTASGGDGDGVQFWYVGYDPTLQTVVVSHQGTDPFEFESLLTDADLFMSSPVNGSMFPSISSGISVHDGFQDEHSETASDILSAVQTTLSQHQTSHVTTVGHSLGAALSLLDAVFLPLHLPGITVQTVLYGLPRVGNEAFADYVDAHIPSLTRITSKRDPIPIVPGRFLGYSHPSGEVHIDSSNAWQACPGQDNPSSECIVGAVSSILPFESDLGDHTGPYNGVTIAC